MEIRRCSIGGFPPSKASIYFSEVKCSWVLNQNAVSLVRRKPIRKQIHHLHIIGSTASQPWCRPHAPTGTVTTACWHRTRRCANKSRPWRRCCLHRFKRRPTIRPRPSRALQPAPLASVVQQSSQQPSRPSTHRRAGRRCGMSAMRPSMRVCRHCQTGIWRHNQHPTIRSISASVGDR